MKVKTGLIAGASMMLVILSGCEKKATGQVVAVVNGEEISQQELNAELQGVNLPPSADKKAIMAQLLQRTIDRKLLVQKAKEQGLDKSLAYVDQTRRMEENLLVELMARGAAKNITLPDAAAVDNYIAQNPSMFAGRKRYALEQIVFDQPSDVAVLKSLEPAKTLDEVAAMLTKQNITFQRGNSALDSGTVPPQIATAINKLPPGEPFVVPANGKVVVSVIRATQDVPTPIAQAKPAAVAKLQQQNLNDAMQKQLKAERAAAKIEYQPGFEPPKTAPPPPAK